MKELETEHLIEQEKINLICYYAAQHKKSRTAAAWNFVLNNLQEGFSPEDNPLLFAEMREWARQHSMLGQSKPYSFFQSHSNSRHIQSSAEEQSIVLLRPQVAHQEIQKRVQQKEYSRTAKMYRVMQQLNIPKSPRR